MDATLAYQHLSPAKGLEMHLVCRADVLSPADPPRFVLHFSPMHLRPYLSDPLGYVARMKGFDPDLSAHFAVTYARGRALCGPEIRTLFQPVPKHRYLKSIAADMAWQPEDCLYHVLNACRTAAYLADGSILSKTEGAAWAFTHLPESDRPLIRQALQCARSDDNMPPSQEAEEFCEKSRVWFMTRFKKHNAKGGFPHAVFYLCAFRVRQSAHPQCFL